MNKTNRVIGNVVNELRFNSFGFGERSWRWKRRYFARFSVEPERWINPHMVIVGESGGGKSNACKGIVCALCAQGARVAILDPHNEYLEISEGISAEVYDASRNGINIFDLDGMSEKERASEITGMFKRNFRLGEVQSYTLYRCIMYMYGVLGERGRAPNIHDLIYTIKIFKKNSNTSSEKNILEALERRLSLVDSGAFEKSADMESVMSGNSVFLLSGLHTAEAQSIYIEGFLRKIYSRMLSSKRSPSGLFYLVIDEAEKLGDNPIIGKLAAEGRKYGIGIIAISQRAKLIDRDLRGNASMFMSFNMREPEELNYIANFIAGGNEMGRFTEVKKAIRSLGRGHAIISSTQRRNPVLVRFGRINGSENMGFSIMVLARNGINRDDVFEKMGHHDMQAVEDKIRMMVDSGSLKEHVIESGSYSGKWYISDNHNSPEHDIAVGIISRHLLSIGIKNSIYNRSYGPDIVAFRSGSRIAIEYETGSKSLEDTAKMIESRAGKYARTITIVNDLHYCPYSKRISDAVKFSDFESALSAAFN